MKSASHHYETLLRLVASTGSGDVGSLYHSRMQAHLVIQIIQAYFSEEIATALNEPLRATVLCHITVLPPHVDPKKSN